MSELTDFLKLKASPTLQMMKMLKAIEEKAVKAAEDAVEKAVNNNVEQMKEAGLLMVVQIAEEKMVELKASFSDQFDAGVKADVEAVFEKSSTTQRFRGREGEKGETGSAGRDGTDGLPGIPGMDAEDGKDGEKGERGKQGEQGSPDTSKQIVKKLNTETESVSMNVIKGLKEALVGIRSLARKKGGGASGGGMGDPQSFVFSGDGATTEFTLPAVPSGNGLAIWVYYQGQWLQPTTHYTVSGTKITITFTADVDTVIEGFLIP